MVNFEPVSEEEMYSRHPWHTFCEVQREIFKMADRIGERDVRDEIKRKARLAVAMAKPMAERIAALDPTWPGAYYGKIGERE